MGCGPSRPSRYHNGHLVSARKGLKTSNKGYRQPNYKKNVVRPRLEQVPRGNRAARPVVENADIAFMEAKYKRDRKIYDEQVKGRKKKMDEQTFPQHAVVRGDQVFF